MKIATFEFGSVKIEKGLVTIQIPKSQFRYDNLKELESMKNNKVDFLPLKDIKEDEDRVTLKYEKLNTVDSLLKIKNESLVVRLSIAKAILEKAPLDNSDVSVSIHPATIFYRPMATVKFTYQANNLMPQEKNHNNFERYKALVLSIVSGFSYEVCLNDKQRVLKSKNPIWLSIAETESKEQLLSDLEEQLDYMQYSFIENVKRNKRKSRMKNILFVVVGVAALLIAVGLTKSAANKQYTTAVASYEEKIDQKGAEVKLQQYLSDGDYDKAAKVMKEASKSKEEISNMYLDAGLFQKALDAYPKNLEKIIETLYKDGKQDKILDLKMDNNEKLDLEKSIVSYDTNTLKGEISFMDDASEEKQALRMAKAFLDHGDVNSAQMIQDKINNKELKNTIELKKKSDQLQEEKDNLKKLQKEKDKEKDKKKKKDKENQEKKTKNAIASLEKEINELKKSSESN
ncbi:type VII secretion protein EssB/YukC [Bacillus atrophaeus]|uniref:type VII secretion protein EssB/YukC n=1 Tax=Bacillus atrophaeus TaxID=1452 RepID=UPI00227F0E54|nr:type VII secretion protein EssB/YukC [Bacillus atrophaeus]MCY8497756.1 hypothetical protein [Bacillus atrophaeus]MCY8814939.1 hypothetical protein [Bacillus atrophaeus]MCY8821559.1 hypothetical protein [Bacillus atrophaeus]MCY8830989.1 hypothetical protein [Bacillus atrophaeus]MCY8835248.1 hypothetical protein [Bacillus atrophaeus]